ncbi:hypothetical protein CEXT_316911 [Caerostris extrusa]|uniref:Uncharacterized protein n=1 Tax=Caerostris extrusa TaxID=172846 RepID=A0AAV4UP04_CAEEX|nr:hypothetical protein CEXT_316911 [Caerostris extrusa]
MKCDDNEDDKSVFYLKCLKQFSQKITSRKKEIKRLRVPKRPFLHLIHCEEFAINLMFSCHNPRSEHPEVIRCTLVSQATVQSHDSCNFRVFWNQIRRLDSVKEADSLADV